MRSAMRKSITYHCLRLAPGLEAVRAEECDTVTIAGMGGQTIAEILTAAPGGPPKATICCCSNR